MGSEVACRGWHTEGLGLQTSLHSLELNLASLSLLTHAVSANKLECSGATIPH